MNDAVAEYVDVALRVGVSVGVKERVAENEIETVRVGVTELVVEPVVLGAGVGEGEMSNSQMYGKDVTAGRSFTPEPYS